jgi:hypothetical protein
MLGKYDPEQQNRSNFRVIEPVMLECAKAGVTKIKFGALPGD